MRTRQLPIEENVDLNSALLFTYGTLRVDETRARAHRDDWRANMNERILVVDDDEIVLSVMGDMLSVGGYQIEAKKNADEALTMFLGDSRGFDLVMTDHYMGAMTGLELGQKILEHKPATPIILLTGGGPAVESEAHAAGIRGIVQKPVKIDQLLETVAQVLRS